MQFKGTLPERPDNISLKAILAWEYFFEDKPGTWAVVRTAGGHWIITDETMELETAQVLPDDESFVEWLEDVADDHLKNMPDEFLGLFITAPELLMDEETKKILVDHLLQSTSVMGRRSGPKEKEEELFTGEKAKRPANISLKAKVAWAYWFCSFGVVRTKNGEWITTNEEFFLDMASIYPDDDSFISWLESSADEQMEDDPASFLRSVVTLPELLDEEVVEFLCDHIHSHS